MIALDGSGGVGIEEGDDGIYFSNVFIDYFVIKNYRGNVRIYNIAGEMCGEYRTDRIGEGLKSGIYFVKIKDRIYKITKIR